LLSVTIDKVKSWRCSALA